MCGIIGMVSLRHIPITDFVGQLSHVNNRGNEEAGLVAVKDAGSFMAPYRGLGLVREACDSTRPEFLRFQSEYDGACVKAVIGHVRYSTVGAKGQSGGQPLPGRNKHFGGFYLIHNGQIPNHAAIRADLEQHGHTFSTDSDSETLAALLAHSTEPTLVEAIQKIIRDVPGAFSIIVLGEEFLVAARDSHGFWPLWCGTDEDGRTIFASELGSLNIVKHGIEVPPGAVFYVQHKGCNELAIRFHQPETAKSHHRCWADVVYLSRPDEGIGDKFVVAQLRTTLGRRIAISCPVEADIVIGVPDSGLDAALGFSAESGIPLEFRGMVRNRYDPGRRSFISPNPYERERIAEQKQSITRRLVQGKRVVAVEDTIIRSTTARVLTKMLFDHGATEVHWRVAAPPVYHPCYFGINIPSREKLIAARMRIDEIAAHIGATSVGYLTHQQTLEVLEQFSRGWCMGCVTGEYPIPIPEELVQLES